MSTHGGQGPLTPQWQGLGLTKRQKKQSVSFLVALGLTLAALAVWYFFIRPNPEEKAAEQQARARAVVDSAVIAATDSAVKSLGLSFSDEQKSEFSNFHPTWQQTMLRIQTKQDVDVLTTHFGFQVVDEYHFPDWKFSLYFLATLPAGVTIPGPPGSPEAHAWLWQTDLVTLELTLNHVPEGEAPEVYINGNVEPHRGFGHIAIHVEDVYAFCDKLEAAGIKFQKKPDDGRMKGLAFALLPTGYWVEIIKRGEPHPALEPCTVPINFSQTMIRVKDPKASLNFYQNVFGMSLIRTIHFSDFSLYFLATLTPEQAAKVPSDPEEAAAFVKTLHSPVLELTHNHGTESNPDFTYYSGNDPGLRGFGHIGFLVDELVDACIKYEAAGVKFKKRPHEGMMKQLAFVYDPDGYWVEVIQRKANL